MDRLNRERRVYAVCLKMEEFTVVGREGQACGWKSRKVVTFRDIEI